MPAYIYDREVSEYEYRQRVRRHRPSSLLPLIAATAAFYGSPERPDAWIDSPYRKYTPWALADAARVSLAYGTEHGRSEATEQDLLRILAAYSRLKDPTLASTGDAAVRLRDFLLRTSGEQFVWQTPEYTALARTAAIYLHSAFPSHRQARCLTPGWDSQVFGCSLTDYIASAQLLWLAAIVGAGRFDPVVLEAPGSERINAVVDRDVVLRVLDRHFATDLTTFREAEKRSVSGLARAAGAHAAQLRRFTFNPLLDKPAVRGFGPGLLCPSPPLVARKATPVGVYFTGLAHFGNDFLVETGYVFEEYIGRQLRLLSNADVTGEITYKIGKDVMQSVDWIVVFDDLVLLVEVKSTMPTEKARLGLERGVAETDSKLGRAYRQINKTAARIDQRHPAFASIPADRPCQALIVTFEPFPLANANLPHVSTPTPDIPTTVVSAAEVERLVTLTDPTPNRLLLDRAGDLHRSTWALTECMAGYLQGRNPLIDQAWAAYPWTAAAARPALAQHGDTS
ncbi:hypothetical protein [Streptomyces vinaceus]|uniref:hypothetical protein n=1 Tax=Streptomyces vinaceus TaxID=1960 RepID=UPI00382CC555